MSHEHIIYPKIRDSNQDTPMEDNFVSNEGTASFESSVWIDADGMVTVYISPIHSIRMPKEYAWKWLHDPQFTVNKSYFSTSEN
jgi:hypothetical protein